MNKRLTYCFAISAAGLLSACATPKEQCISNATQQYRSIQSALMTANGNINRGYAVHEQSVPYTVEGTCYRNDPATFAVIPYSCPSTAYRTQTTPVSINAAEERSKIAQYQQMLPQLRQQANAQVQQCNAQFPT